MTREMEAVQIAYETQIQRIYEAEVSSVNTITPESIKDRMRKRFTQNQTTKAAFVAILLERGLVYD